MYYESYDDYMRANNGGMGIPNPYFNYTYQPQFNPNNQSNISKLYPDIYTDINRRIDSNMNGGNYNLTEENINKITDEIFEEYKDKSVDSSKNAERAKNNNLIRDLIKIIVIKTLVSKCRNNKFYNMPPQMPGINGYYPY